MAKIKVENTEISVVSVQNEDYISLTDMAHSQMQEHIIFRWMSLRAFCKGMDSKNRCNRHHGKSWPIWWNLCSSRHCIPLWNVD